MIELLKYYYDISSFKFGGEPIVIRIAIALTVLFIIVNILLAITLLLKKIKRKKKKLFVINKKGKNYNVFKKIATNHSNLSYELLQVKLASFAQSCDEPPQRIID